LSILNLDRANKFKDEGNKYFQYKKYRNAIIAYTEGIKQRCSDPTVNAALFCNRATANFHLGKIKLKRKFSDEKYQLR
jgi:hypothetical protein